MVSPCNRNKTLPSVKPRLGLNPFHPVIGIPRGFRTSPDTTSPACLLSNSRHHPGILTVGINFTFPSKSRHGVDNGIIQRMPSSMRESIYIKQRYSDHNHKLQLSARMMVLDNKSKFLHNFTRTTKNKFIHFLDIFCIIVNYSEGIFSVKLYFRGGNYETSTALGDIHLVYS